jgi:hypothetical protein
VPRAVGVSVKEPSQGYQLRVVQEVLLALLAQEPSHGYQVRARLQLALGPLAEVLNAPAWSPPSASARSIARTARSTS